MCTMIVSIRVSYRIIVVADLYYTFIIDALSTKFHCGVLITNKLINADRVECTREKTLVMSLNEVAGGFNNTLNNRLSQLKL